MSLQTHQPVEALEDVLVHEGVPDDGGQATPWRPPMSMYCSRPRGLKSSMDITSASCAPSVGRRKRRTPRCRCWCPPRADRGAGGASASKRLAHDSCAAKAVVELAVSKHVERPSPPRCQRTPREVRAGHPARTPDRSCATGPAHDGLECTDLGPGIPGEVHLVPPGVRPDPRLLLLLGR